MTLASRRRGLLVVIAFLALGIGELVALNRFAVREVTWAYPTGMDQAFYGVETFWRYQQMLTQDFRTFVTTFLSVGGTQGVLLQLQGALTCLVFGPGWLRLLNVNFVYFLLLQGATAYAGWRVGGRRLRWAVLSLGLVLTLGTPYHWTGGVMDFRLDFGALCVYGAFVAMVIASGVFSSRSWSLAASGMAGVLVWLRTLTLAYVIGISLGLLVYFCFRLKAGSATKLRHLGLWFGVFVALVSPVAVVRASALYAYYWVGHVAGAERSIRVQELGLTHLWDHLNFYPWLLIQFHLGAVFLAVAGLVLFVALGWWLSDWRRRAAEVPGWPGLDAFVFCVLCFGVPLTVLTLDASKSDAATGIMGPPAVWLIILAARRLAGARLSSGRAGLAFAVLVLAVGLGHMSWELTRHRPLWFERDEVGRLLRIHDQISSAAADMGASNSGGFSTFGLYEYMNIGVVNFLAYERHRHPLYLHGELGLTIFATDLDDATAKINRSAFVITAGQRPESELVYPFDRTLQPLIPALTEYVRERFIFMSRFTFRGQRHEVYRRPVVGLRGISDGWVTADGLVIEIGQEDKRRASELILRGTSGMNRVSGLQVSAFVMGAREKPVDVDFRVFGDAYAMSIPLGGLAAGPGPLSIRLSFSGYFVPKDLGIGADRRRLVVLAPRERTLVLKPLAAGL